MKRREFLRNSSAGPGRLAASSAGRVIDVANGTNTTDITISAVLTGSQNFEKRGLGTLETSPTSSGVTIDAGSLGGLGMIALLGRRRR